MRTEIHSTTTPAGTALTTIEDGEATKILMTGPDGRGHVLGTVVYDGATTLIHFQDHGTETTHADVLRAAATLLDGRCATALLDVEDLFGGAR